MLDRICADCGRKITIVVRPDGHYKGGQYFAKIPLHSKAERKKEMGGGTHKSKIGSMTVTVLNYDPKPYRHVEYWECNWCYNRAVRADAEWGRKKKRV